MNFLHKIKMKLKRPKKVEKLEIVEDNCVGCGKCARMCKREVFAIDDKKAFVSNLEACVGCGKCIEKMCNFNAINLLLAKPN